MNISEVQSSTGYLTQVRRFLSPLVPSISWGRVRGAFASLGGCFKSKPAALQERRIIDVSNEQPQRSFVLKCFAGLAAGAVLSSGVYAIARRLPSEELQQNPFLPATQGGIAPPHRFGSTLTKLPDLVLTEEVPYTGPRWFVQDVFGPEYEGEEILNTIFYVEGMSVNLHRMKMVSSVPILGGGHTFTTSDYGEFWVTGCCNYNSILSYMIDIDMTDPSNPRVLEVVLSNVERLVKRGQGEYGIIQTSPTKRVFFRGSIDVELPETTSFDFGGLAVGSKYSYLTTNFSLLIVDLDKGEIASSLPILDGGSIEIYNNNFVILATKNTIQIINVTNPCFPKQISQPIFNYPSRIQGLAIDGKYCYFVSTDYIDVIDISNITNPYPLNMKAQLGIIGAPGLRGIVVNNGICYVTDNLSLQVFYFDIPNRRKSKIYQIFTGTSSLHSNDVKVFRDYCIFTGGNGINIITKGEALSISGTPRGGTQGNYTIKFYTFEGLLPRKEISFSLWVKPAITISQMIPIQFAQIGQSFTYPISSKTFKHVNGQALKYRSDGFLPTWLTLNEGGVFSSVIPPTKKETADITVIAKDNYGATASTNFQVKVLYGPSVRGNKPISDQITKANIPFKVSFADVFQDLDQGSPDFTGMDYSATDSGQPLPKWLTLNSHLMTISGMPPKQDVGSIMQIDLTARAFPYNLTATTNFQLTVVMPTSPELRTPLNNRVAPIGDQFKYAVPLDTFIDPYDGPISYSAQYNAEWLSFVNNTFTGKPGHGDTDLISNRIEVITVIAQSQGLSSKTTFNITITGDSYFTLIVFKIISPILSGLGTAFGIYKKRAMILNRWNKKKYLKADSNVQAGQPFSRPLSVPREDIRYVRVLYNGKNLAGEEGNELPHQFKYDRFSNSLESAQLPEPRGLKYLTIQVLGDAGVILEQFNIRFSSSDSGDTIPSDDIELDFSASRGRITGDYVQLQSAGE